MLDPAVSQFGPNNLGQGYQPVKSQGNSDIKSPPRNPNGNPLNVKTSFSQALDLLYRGHAVTSPSVMYTDTYLKLELESGRPILYSYSLMALGDWQRTTLVSIPAAFLFANDWSLAIVVDKK